MSVRWFYCHTQGCPNYSRPRTVQRNEEFNCPFCGAPLQLSEPEDPLRNDALPVGDQKTQYASLVTFPRTMDEMFANGIKRCPGELILPPARVPGYKVIELGQGNNPVPEAEGFAHPEWVAPERLDMPDGSVHVVHAHHFFEHLRFEDVVATLSEVDRVLIEGGVAYITVPHAQSAIGYGSADHRTFWTEKTWQTLFYSLNYDARFQNHWDLNISYMAIAGINFHELCLLVQLVKNRNHVSIWRKT